MNRQIHEEIEENGRPERLSPTVQTFESETQSISGDCARTTTGVEELSQAVRRRKRSLRRIPYPLTAGYLSLMSMGVMISIPVTGMRPLSYVLLAIIAGSWFSVAALLFSGNARLRTAINLQAGKDDVDLIGPLAEALSAGEPACSISGSLLMRLLPLVQPEMLAALTDEQRRCLRSALISASNRFALSRYNPPLVLAILRLFERAGDEADLKSVERLAVLPAFTREAKSIRAAASQCLASMRNRLIGDSGALAERVEILPAHTADITHSLESVELLADRLKKIARIRRRNLLITGVSSVVGTGAALVSLMLSHGGNNGSPLLSAVLFGSLGTMLGFALSGMYSQRNIMNALMHTSDLQTVPSLIQAAATVEISSAAAVMLLTRLLPTLRASDAGLFDTETRALFNTAIIKHAHNTEFVLAALKALQQVGDSTAIPAAQRLAERKGRGESAPAVRAAALECLEFLQMSAAQSQAERTLLRASGAHSPPSSLLRPVESSGPEDSDSLLRTSAAPVAYVERVVQTDAEEIENTRELCLGV